MRVNLDLKIHYTSLVQSIIKLLISLNYKTILHYTYYLNVCFILGQEVWPREGDVVQDFWSRFGYTDKTAAAASRKGRDAARTRPQSSVQENTSRAGQLIQNYAMHLFSNILRNELILMHFIPHNTLNITSNWKHFSLKHQNFEQLRINFVPRSVFCSLWGKTDGCVPSSLLGEVFFYGNEILIFQCF